MFDLFNEFFGFTDEEIRDALREGVKIHPSDFGYELSHKQKMEECKRMENIARRQLAIRNGKVFLQGDKTVLKVGDDVYVAKCEKGDKYDPEKGLMVCIMKAFGFGTKDFLHLFENAKGQPYKEPVKNSKKSLKDDKKR